MADTKTPDEPSSGERTPQCGVQRRGRCGLLPLSMVLSLVLHVAVSIAVITTAANWRHPDLASIYTVDLVAPEPPAPQPPPQPVPEPRAEPPSEPTPDAAPRPTAPRAETPPPEPPPSPSPPPDMADEPAGHGPLQKGLLLDEPGLPETAAPIPGVTAISPVTPPPATAQLGGPDLPGVVVTDQGVRVGGLHGFAGMADTFALEQIGADVFTEEEYSGHYRTRDGRCIDLVDARQSEDMLILHLPGLGQEKGLARGLTRYGKMIYTHGPGLRAFSPVDGTIYLLPKKARYNDENIDVPNQLMWMPDAPPMRYAEKVAISERALVFESGGTTLTGILAWTRQGGWTGRGPGPAAVLALAGCPPPSALLALARRYALHGLTVLAFAPRGCDQGREAWDTALPGLLADDVLAAAAQLRKQPEADAKRVGVIGLGAGAALALKAAADQDMSFAIMTCPSGAADPDRCALPVPRVTDLLRARAPLVWLLPPGDSGHPDRWREHLERIRRAGLPDDAARLLPDPVPAGAGPDEANWLRTLDHAPAREAAAWAADLP